MLQVRIRKLACPQRWHFFGEVNERLKYGVFLTRRTITHGPPKERERKYFLTHFLFSQFFLLLQQCQVEAPDSKYVERFCVTCIYFKFYRRICLKYRGKSSYRLENFVFTTNMLFLIGFKMMQEGIKFEVVLGQLARPV